MTYILAVDIGGTHPRMGMVAMEGASAHLIGPPVRMNNVKDALLPSLTQYLAGMSGEGIKPVAICVCAAGEIINGKVHHMANAVVNVDVKALEASFQVPVSVINDFEAVGYGVKCFDVLKEALPILDPAHIPGGCPLIQLPVDGIFATPLPKRNRAVVGPGTGLGVAYLQVLGNSYNVAATEAGHSGFGCPPQYAKLAQYLESIHASSHLGMEAFVSGPAIANITSFLVQECRAGRSFPVYLTSPVVDHFIDVLEKASPADLPAIVSVNTSNSRICFAAMSLFFEFLAIACSSVALQSLSLGGLFLAGGILPKNIDHLYHSPFLQQFTKNWKKQAILAQIPLYLVLDYNISLIGCAAAAQERLS